jgi:RHS repeat-associated protein
VTDAAGNVTSIIDVDPWGGETARSSNSAFQPHKFTSYERDGNYGDDAQMRRYQSYWMRFSQPDSYDGSYNLANPQSLNRYAYVHNDPVNFVDPSGLEESPFDRDTNRQNLLTLLGGGRSGGIRRPRPLPLDPPGRGDNSRDPTPVDSFNPFAENPRYAECAKLTSNAPPSNAASAIDAVASLTGISPTLLAVTWANESGFSFAPMQNLNDLTPGNVDVGPLQINYNTFHSSSAVSGLSNVFGDLNSTGIFNGNPFENLVAGARILRGYGSGRTAAGRYRTGTGSFSKSKQGKVDFKIRAESYDKLAKGYDAFFDCLRGK